MKNLLSADVILPQMRAQDWWAAIVELVEHLISKGKLPTEHRDEILISLRNREEQISTGIGHGVAIPHTFSNNLEKVVAAFGRSPGGIDFGGIDNKPVELIILFIVPSKNHHLHIRTLSTIAKHFSNAEVRRRLVEANDNLEILDVLTSKPKRT